MKKFSRITAALAVALILWSMLMLFGANLFKKPIMEHIFEYPEIFYMGFWYAFPAPYFLICFLQLIFLAPMIFLGGRKKGGIWVEIILLLLIFVTIPLVSRIADRLWQTMTYAIGTYYQTITYIEINSAFYHEPIVVSSFIDKLRLFGKILLNVLKTADDMGYFSSYLYDKIWVMAKNSYLHTLFSWCMGGARLGMILGFVSIGVSMAGVAKQRKAKKAAKRIENQPDTPAISQ